MYYKKRIFNTRNYLTIILIFLVLLSTYFFTFIFPTLIIDPNSPNYISDDPRPLLVAQVLNWRIVKFGGRVVFHLYPLFTFLPLLGFREDLLTYFTFGRHRFPSFKGELFKKILFYCVLLSVILFLGHVLYYTFMIPFVIDPTWKFGEMLTGEFIPIGTFDQQGYLYLIVEAILLNIVAGFTFTIMTCAVLLWSTNIYWMFFIPISYYYVSINAYLYLSTPDLTLDFLSIYPFLSGEMELSRGLLHALIPIGGSLIMILLALMKEKRGGIHAN